jgi:hypothetical protein
MTESPGHADGARMSTIHFKETTSTPEQFVAALTDFGPGRSKVWGNSADNYLTIYERSPTRPTLKKALAASGNACTTNWSGRVLAIALGTGGKRVLEKRFDQTVKAIEEQRG